MTKVLFICHGNICRSPMAEFVMKQLVAEACREQEFQIESAAVSTEEIGNDLYPPAKRKLTEKGVPFTRHAARQITREDYQCFDYIICMDHSNLRLLRYLIGEDTLGKVSLLLEWTDVSRDVADSWYTGDFEAADQDILQGCQAFLKAV